MRTPYSAALLAAVMTPLATAAVAAAAIVYAPNNLGTDPAGTGPDTLVRFDSANPAGYVTIGSMGVNNVGFGGMDFDRDGNLWAYASFFKSTGGAASGLYRVNTATGAATVQGTASLQSLQDIAFNPADDQMYGVNTQANTTRLYRIDLASGATTAVGVVTGLPASHNNVGLAFDSGGNFYLHDQTSDAIYKGAGLSASLLYSIPLDTNFSQGMTIDWSRDDTGYHGAVGYGDFPNYFARVNTFATDGSAYVLGPDFGPNIPVGQFTFPPVEPGDLAIAPLVPEPAGAAAVGVVAAAGLLARRRGGR